MIMLDRLRRFAKGINKDFTPKSPILLLPSFRVRIDKLRRLAKGDSRD